MGDVRAICVLSSDNSVIGAIEFIQKCDGGPVSLKGNLEGLTPGKHAIIIHEYGDISSLGSNAGNHFNPTQQDHGAPTDKIRHAGDLGNLEANPEGKVCYSLVDNMISLVGPQSIIGRSVLVHENEDDFGKGEHELSKVNGNSGGVIACGVIGIAK